MSSVAFGQTAEEFYEGNGLTIVVASSAGGTFDLFGRLVARHISKYLPGEPTVVVQNMVGAGGLTAANYLYNVAEKDGSVIAVLQRNIFIQDALDLEGVNYDIGAFNYIGNPLPEPQVLFAKDTSGFETIEDLTEREMVVSGLNPGGDNQIMYQVLREALGANIRTIWGYPGLQEMMLAIEREEVDGTLSSWGGVKSVRPAWVEEDTVNILLQMGKERFEELADTPTIFEYLTEESDIQIVELLSIGLTMAYPFVAPPGVPEDRVEFLRDAYLQAMADPELIADALTQGYIINPLSGAGMEEAVVGITATPQEVITRARVAAGLE